MPVNIWREVSGLSYIYALSLRGIYDHANIVQFYLVKKNETMADGVGRGRITISGYQVIRVTGTIW